MQKYYRGCKEKRDPAPETRHNQRKLEAAAVYD